MGLVALLASLVLISLHLVGLAFKTSADHGHCRGSDQAGVAGLTLTALSGTLMFIATPKLYFYNPAFRLKMVLFFIAVIVQLALFRRTAAQTGTDRRRLLAPASASRSPPGSVSRWRGG